MKQIKVTPKTIEHVAKALYEANGFVRGWDHPKVNPVWKPTYRKQAKAAIKAMRELEAQS